MAMWREQQATGLSAFSRQVMGLRGSGVNGSRVSVLTLLMNAARRCVFEGGGWG